MVTFLLMCTASFILLAPFSHLPCQPEHVSDSLLVDTDPAVAVPQLRPRRDPFQLFGRVERQLVERHAVPFISGWPSNRATCSFSITTISLRSAPLEM